MANNRKRTYKRKNPLKKPTKNDMAKIQERRLVSMVKKITLNQAETKYSTKSITFTELYHNSLNNFGTNILAGLPNQGTGDGDRVGDSINMVGIKFRLMLGQKGDRPNVSFRVFVVSYEDSTSGNPTAYNDFFHNVSGNALLDPVQYKRFHVLKQFTVRNTKGSVDTFNAAKEYTRSVQFWVPYKKKVQFRGDSSILPVNIPEHMNVIVVPYDAQGTLVSDNIAYGTGAATIYYKDP